MLENKALTIEQKAKLYDELQQEYQGYFKELKIGDVESLMGFRWAYENTIESCSVSNIIREVVKQISALHYLSDSSSKHFKDQMLSVETCGILIKTLSDMDEAAKTLSPNI